MSLILSDCMILHPLIMPELPYTLDILFPIFYIFITVSVIMQVIYVLKIYLCKL